MKSKKLIIGLSLDINGLMPSIVSDLRKAELAEIYAYDTFYDGGLDFADVYDTVRGRVLYGETDSWSDDYVRYSKKRKEIYFYNDIHNPTHYREFKTLHEFSNYCDSHEIYVPNYAMSTLVYEKEIHCCLDPIDMGYGEKVLVCDKSYGGLQWSARDSDDYDEMY